MVPLRPDALDDVIHGRIRLGVVAYLVQQNRASFTELAQVLETTNGSLSVHLKKLAGAGYVEIDKRFVGGRPLTTIRLTDAGTAAWQTYLDTLAVIYGNERP